MSLYSGSAGGGGIAAPEAGYIATASAEEASSEEASSEETSSDSKLIIYNKDCTYNIIYRPSEHKIYLRKDTLDPATGAVKADGQGKESLMAENVTGFTPDLSEAEARTLSELSWTLRQGTRSIHQNRTSLCAIRCRPGQMWSMWHRQSLKE